MTTKLKKIIKKIIPTSRIKFNKRENRFLKKFYSEQSLFAVENFSKEIERNSYLADMKEFHISVSEWILYNFSSLNKEQKDEFLTAFDAFRAYRKYNLNKVRELFYDKAKFIKHYKQYINRAVILPPPSNSNTDITEYKNKLYLMLRLYDCMIKPTEGNGGQGIFKIAKGECKDFDKIVQKIIEQKMIVEECIQGDQSLQKFNPQSLNTIRIVTAFNGTTIEPFYACARFGVNAESIVDNTKHGGLCCHINLDTGIIDSDAVDSERELYKFHPSSKYQFKGTEISNWDSMRKQAINMHRNQDLPFIGWDLCVNSKGEIDVIEGNHGPDVGTWQYPMMIGVKSKFNSIINGFEIYLKKNNKQGLYPHLKFHSQHPD